jgi:hypothetical protein
LHTDERYLEAGAHSPSVKVEGQNRRVLPSKSYPTLLNLSAMKTFRRSNQKRWRGYKW